RGRAVPVSRSSAPECAGAPFGLPVAGPSTVPCHLRRVSSVLPVILATPVCNFVPTARGAQSDKKRILTVAGRDEMLYPRQSSTPRGALAAARRTAPHAISPVRAL